MKTKLILLLITLSSFALKSAAGDKKTSVLALIERLETEEALKTSLRDALGYETLEKPFGSAHITRESIKALPAPDQHSLIRNIEKLKIEINQYLKTDVERNYHIYLVRKKHTENPELSWTYAERFG